MEDLPEGEYYLLLNHLSDYVYNNSTWYQVVMSCESDSNYTEVEDECKFFTTQDYMYTTGGGNSLEWLGWDPYQTLWNCQGDCDSDSDCGGSLVCYHDGTPPGCIDDGNNQSISSGDYCYEDTDDGGNITFCTSHDDCSNSAPFCYNYVCA